MQSNQVLTADWVSREAFFYNSKTKKASKNILDVIDYHNFNWDQEGLYNFLRAGYCVFGKTPINDVNFLYPGESLDLNNFKISRNQSDEDQLFASIQSRSTPKQCLDLMQEKLETFSNEFQGDVILPLSGGLDSRLILHFFKNKKNIQAYTYGASPKQYDSFEVLNAKELARIFNLKWEWIKLGKQNEYLDDYYKCFGPSTHLHGMYHIEFYKEILKRTPSRMLLSGLIGDVWAGSVKIPSINSPSELFSLCHNHGMQANPEQLAFTLKSNSILESFYEIQKEKLKDARWRILTTLRTKMMLLKYLTLIPESLGIKTYAPFVEKDLALAMLTLPDKEREDRAWQREFLRSIKLDLSEIEPLHNYVNNLNSQAMKEAKLKPLSPQLLQEIFKPEYIEWVNKNLKYSPLKTRVFDRLNRTRISKYYQFKDHHLKAYYAYLNLLPLQKVIEKRNEVVK